MTESYDPAYHLLMIAFIVFYWHLLRIWHQPPPTDRDDKTPDNKATAAPSPKLAGLALRQMAKPPADAVRRPDPAPPVSPGGPLAAIRAADETFDEATFLAGAARAYELIVDAFAEGDLPVLRNLLDPEAASAFADAISARKARGERSTLRFIGIEDMQVVDAWADASQTEITVRFAAEAVAATYASDGAVVDGDPEKVVRMVDRWTFARRSGSRDPNWKVVATEEG